MSQLRAPTFLPALATAAVARACGHIVRRGAKSVAIGVGEIMAALASRA